MVSLAAQDLSVPLCQELAQLLEAVLETAALLH